MQIWAQAAWASSRGTRGERTASPGGNISSQTHRSVTASHVYSDYFQRFLQFQRNFKTIDSEIVIMRLACQVCLIFSGSFVCGGPAHMYTNQHRISQGSLFVEVSPCVTKGCWLLISILLLSCKLYFYWRFCLRFCSCVSWWCICCVRTWTRVSRPSPATWRERCSPPSTSSRRLTSQVGDNCYQMLYSVTVTF